VDGLWATNSEGVVLIVRAILVSKISKLCDPDPPTLQMDGQTTCNLNTALCTIVHRAVKSGYYLLLSYSRHKIYHDSKITLRRGLYNVQDEQKTSEKIPQQ